jgi:tetratricopeptide (TPR) repeat protein
VLKALRASLAKWRTPGAGTAARLETAQALQRRGEHDAAAKIYDDILAADPTQFDALLLSARLEGRRGRLQLAQARLAAALASNPNSARAHADLGNVLRLAGDTGGAAASYETALALDPGLAAAWNNSGLLHLAAGRTAEAGAAFARALQCEPAFAEALRNLVGAMTKLGQHVELRAMLESMLARNQDNAEVHAALGFVELRHFAAPERALVQFDRALELGVGHAEFLVNRGIALHDLGRIEEAVASYDAALAVDPGYQLARFHRALARLIEQRFELAWEDYEARLVLPVVPPRHFDYPQWSGEELGGKTLLILAEQGLGDEIMFASCFAEVISRAKRCVIDCSPKLAPIFMRSFPQAIVHGGTQFDEPAWLAGLPRPDYQIRAGSLPRLLRSRLSAFPRHQGYLAADPQKVQSWRSRLAARGSGLKVGVSWRGGTALSRGGLRSLKLDDLAPILAVPGVHFVSLQYDAGSDEVAAYCARSGQALEYAAAAIDDYDETAALVAALDLVVSVCTAVIHLGGALATPVWIMAPRVPEWRYGIRGESMPWYPGNRVLRQTAPGDWGGVIERVAVELAARLRDKSA